MGLGGEGLAGADVAGVALELDVVVGELAELAVVEANVLLLGGDAQAEAGHQVHQEQDQARHDERVGEAGDRVGELVAELDPVVVDPAAGDDGEAVEVGDVVTTKLLIFVHFVLEGGRSLRGKEGSADVASNTTNSVDGKDIESVVDANQELELGGDVAYNTTDDAENDGSPGGNVTRAGSDGNETGNGTGAEADSGPLLLQAVVEKAPGDTTDRGGNVGDDAGHDGAQVSSEGRAAVEAEPANPQEHGSEDDVGHVVRSVRETGGLGVASSLAEHERVGEGCST